MLKQTQQAPQKAQNAAQGASEEKKNTVFMKAFSSHPRMKRQILGQSRFRLMNFWLVFLGKLDLKGGRSKQQRRGSC